jgi:hypothetical protein
MTRPRPRHGRWRSSRCRAGSQTRTACPCVCPSRRCAARNRCRGCCRRPDACDRCRSRKDAWQRWRKETLQNISDMCATRKGRLPAELATALAVVVPNKQSAGAALDRVQGMTWIGRAGAQGDLYAQKFYHDLSGAFTTTNHSYTSQENMETGLWIERNCPALC